MSAALREVGLFCIQSKISELKHAFNKGRIRLVKLRFVHLHTNVRACMHTDQSISLDGETEIHTVASLLKLYLRELPEPLLTYHLFDDFINATTGLLSALYLYVCMSHSSHYITAYQSDATTGLALIRLVLSHLPAENIALLRFLWYASVLLFCWVDNTPIHLDSFTARFCMSSLHTAQTT